MPPTTQEFLKRVREMRAAREAAAAAAAKAASEEAAELAAKAASKRGAGELSDSEEDSDFGNDDPDLDEGEDLEANRAKRARQEVKDGKQRARVDSEYESLLSAEQARRDAENILKAVNAEQEAFVKLLGDVKTKLEDDALLDAFFCQPNGVLFCENLKMRKKEYKTYFQVRKEGLYAITCNTSENDKSTLTFRLSFACEIKFENYTVWIDKIDHGKTSIMIETKTEGEQETTFETLVLLPSGKQLDSRRPSASNPKSMWDWFTAHFIEGIRETIVRGTTSKTVIYGSEAYIIKGTITPARKSKPEATKITKAVKVPLHSITLGDLVTLAKEGKALATIKGKVAVDTLTLTKIERIQLKDPSKVKPEEKKLLQGRRDPTPEERTQLNYKNDQFKMLKRMYAGKDLKSRFNLTKPEIKAGAGKAVPQTASRCFPAVGNLTMTGDNSTYLSYPRNLTWNRGHLKAFENEVKKDLLRGIATGTDIQDWADFCIAELRTALGLLDADDLNLDEAMESDEGEAGPPEEDESRRVAEQAVLNQHTARKGAEDDFAFDDDFTAFELTPQSQQWSRVGEHSIDKDMQGSEDERGTPTEIRGAAQGAEMEVLSPGNAGAPYAPGLDPFTPYMRDEYDDRPTGESPSWRTPAVDTPQGWDTPAKIDEQEAARLLQQLSEFSETNARFVDRCLSFY
jgi:hypothetical protein